MRLLRRMRLLPLLSVLLVTGPVVGIDIRSGPGFGCCEKFTLPGSSRPSDLVDPNPQTHHRIIDASLDFVFRIATSSFFVRRCFPCSFLVDISAYIENFECISILPLIYQCSISHKRSSLG